MENIADVSKYIRMTSPSKLACFRSMTLLGCFLAMTQQYIGAYWGNLSVYTDSYLRASLGPDSGFQTPWTISCSMLGAPIGMTVSDVVRKRLGTHGTPIVGCVAYSFTLGISYLTIGQSAVLFEVVLGFATGCSFGVIYSHVLWVVSEWCSSRHIGFYSGLVIGGEGLGPLVIIQLVTWFINPHNKVPDLRAGNRAFFTQREILNRVPSVFLVLCGFALSVHLLGILLIRDVKHVQLMREKQTFITTRKTEGPNSEEQITEPNSEFHESTNLTVPSQNRSSCGDLKSRQGTSESIVGTDSVTSKCPASLELNSRVTYGTDNETKLLLERRMIYATDLISYETTDSTGSCGASDRKDTGIEKSHYNLWNNQTNKDEHINRPGLGNDDKSTTSMRHKGMNKKQTNSNGNDSVPNVHDGESLANDDTELRSYQTSSATFERSDRGSGDLSPWQVLKAPMFYVICLCANCTDLSFILISNYYKAYGQLYIKDDHFLADVGTMILVAYIFTRPLWGLMMDYIGLKNTLVFFTSGLALGFAFWYFTVLIDKWLYLIWTVMVGNLIGGFYFVFAMSSLKLFGREYYTRNTGLILASTVPLNLVCPHIIGLILRHSGYWTLFLMGSCLSTVAVALVILFIPRHERD